MEYLIYLLLLCSLFLVFSLVLSSLAKKRLVLNQRLSVLRSQHQTETIEDEFELPFVNRILEPIYERFIDVVGKFTPQGIKDNYQEKITQAGLAKQYTPLRIVGLQILFSLVVLIAGSTLYSGISTTSNPMLLLLAGGISFYLPYSLIRSKALARRQIIEKNLPDLLDLLYISVEAGLGFDAALKKTAEKMGGPLSEEIIRALDDINKGKERIPALRSIGERTGVDDVRSFIMAVIQSELLGSNIANMLRVQSRVMRERRRQRAEEKAHKLPIKMLFPLVFLMFPALFVIILGPAIIKLLEMF